MGALIRFIIATPSLTKSEWIFGLALLVILSTFFLIAKETGFRSLERLNQHQQPLPVPMVVVEVSGCVKKPGKINIPQGSPIHLALRKAGLKSLSDLSNINLDQPIHSSCSFHIPVLEKIVVEIQGAVRENVLLEMPAGSRICDLKKRLDLASDADLSFFKRRKILKNNELIHVPFKHEIADATHSE